MQKEYKKFMELLNEKQVTKDNLQKDIEVKEEEINSLHEEYKKALMNNDDKKADSKQDEIYELKKQIERNQDKLSLVGVGDTQLEEQASKVLNETNEAIQKLSDEAVQKGKEYHELRKELIAKAHEVSKYRSADHKYIKAVENVADTLPAWADKQDRSLRYDEFVKRHRYTKKSRVPSLMAFNERELYKAERGV